MKRINTHIPKNLITIFRFILSRIRNSYSYSFGSQLDMLTNAKTLTASVC